MSVGTVHIDMCSCIPLLPSCLASCHFFHATCMHVFGAHSSGAVPPPRPCLTVIMCASLWPLLVGLAGERPARVSNQPCHVGCLPQQGMPHPYDVYLVSRKPKPQEALAPCMEPPSSA